MKLLAALSTATPLLLFMSCATLPDSPIFFDGFSIGYEKGFADYGSNRYLELDGDYDALSFTMHFDIHRPAPLEMPSRPIVLPPESFEPVKLELPDVPEITIPESTAALPWVEYLIYIIGSLAAVASAPKAYKYVKEKRK